MAILPAFRWYKDLYRRGAQYKLFRIPSPASEDPHRDDLGLSHYRTLYLYSEHNVRRDTYLNSERKVTVYLATLDPDMPMGDK